METLSKEESTKYLDQMITFQQQEMTEIKNRITTAWTTFYKYKQEVTSEIVPSSTSASLFRHGGRSNDDYVSGTWTLSKVHERMIQLTQHQMLRLIIQTKGKYKKTTHDKNDNKLIEEVGKQENEKDGEEEENNGNFEDETDGNCSYTDRDQDSDFSFMNDTEEEIDTAEIEEEGWIMKPWNG